MNYVESFQAKAIDYDFIRDVGLIRFRAGRQLPASRVVPAHWQPVSAPRPMKMLTVGCSEGRDATAWHTRIMNPRLKGFLQGKPAYEAIECEFAPKQGRSGGGLFTTDGYIAGVCNFAEPQGDHGLYATPRSIYAILDRNNLSALYAPVVRDGGPGNTLMADSRDAGPARARAPLTGEARMQSPDTDEPTPSRSAADRGEVLLPHYRFLGIKDPVGTDGNRAASPPRTGSSSRRVAWMAPREETRTTEPEPEPVNANVDDQPATEATTTMTPATTPTTPTAEVRKPASTRPRWLPAAAAVSDN